MTKIVAHRGANRVAPENTMPAFQRALEWGVDGIELDVQCSRDGELMVIHDFSVDRTTEGTGKVAEMTCAQLREFDARAKFGYVFLGTKIPILQDVLDLVGDRCMINIEIKSIDLQGGDEVDKVAALIKERKLYDQVIVSSFNPISLIKMRHVDKAVRLGLLYVHPLPAYLYNAWLSPILSPEALHPKFNFVDHRFMEDARAREKAVNVWTVNDTGEATRLQTLGVDSIITDVPDVIMAALTEDTPAE